MKSFHLKFVLVAAAVTAASAQSHGTDTEFEHLPAEVSDFEADENLVAMRARDLKLSFSLDRCKGSYTFTSSDPQKPLTPKSEVNTSERTFSYSVRSAGQRAANGMKAVSMTVLYPFAFAGDLVSKPFVYEADLIGDVTLMIEDAATNCGSVDKRKVENFKKMAEELAHRLAQAQQDNAWVRLNLKKGTFSVLD